MQELFRGLKRMPGPEAIDIQEDFTGSALNKVCRVMCLRFTVH